MSEIQWEGVPCFVAGNRGGALIKDTTKKLAETLPGMAISPDLYRGRVTQDPDEAGHLMSGLDFKGAVEDIRKCAQYLKSKGCKRIGITGFCMGGSLTIASAVHVGGKGIDAGVCYYGIPPPDFAPAKDIAVPLQYHFGDSDEAAGFSDKATADKLKADLVAAGKDTSQFFQYPAPVGHAFMNATSPGYNEGAAKQGMERMLGFFRKHLTVAKM